MRKIYNYLIQFHRGFFRWQFFVATSFFLAICIGLNFHLDFEDTVIDSYYGQPIQTLYFFLFMGFPYYVITVLYAHFYNKWSILKSRQFWIWSVLSLFMISLTRAIYIHEYYWQLFPKEARLFVFRIGYRFNFLITQLIPLGALFFLFKKRLPDFYGLNTKNFDIRPYAIMLLLMVPLIFAASFDSSFLRQYPMYKTGGAEAIAQVYGWPIWVPASVYEVVYAFGFISTELMFRGVMVVAMARFIGSASIFAMVGAYVFLHFGKPIGEAISSAFGGYLLGIIAYYSRNIWGGVAVHMGIALLMELMAVLVVMYWIG